MEAVEADHDLDPLSLGKAAVVVLQVIVQDVPVLAQEPNLSLHIRIGC